MSAFALLAAFVAIALIFLFIIGLCLAAKRGDEQLEAWHPPAHPLHPNCRCTIIGVDWAAPDGDETAVAWIEGADGDIQVVSIDSRRMVH